MIKENNTFNGNVIKVLRGHLLQDEFIKICDLGITNVTLSRYENGKINKPDGVLLNKIANHFKKSNDIFFNHNME